MALDLYGFKTGDLASRRAEIDTLFVATMEPQLNTYTGEYHGLRLATGVNLNLQRNRRPTDASALAEEEFPGHPVLLYVESTGQADKLRELLLRSLEGIEFLRREIVTEDGRFLRILRKAGRDFVVLEKRLEAAMPAFVQCR